MSELSASQCLGIVEQLAQQQLCVIDNAFGPAFCRELLAELSVLPLRQAAIGRGPNQQVRADIRSDQTCWLDVHGPMQARYLASMQQLLEQMNAQLFLGLHEYEAHYACYQPGAYYRRHLDSFRGSLHGNSHDSSHGSTHNYNPRRITSTFYLNADWQDSDGGHLQIYQSDEDKVGHAIAPLMGRLVLFVSERFPHEVLPAHKPRHSIAGWFRVRT